MVILGWDNLLKWQVFETNYKIMIRRPSYREFLNQTIQSQQLPSYSKPPLPSSKTPAVPYPPKHSTYPTNSDYNPTLLAQTLAQLPPNPNALRHTQGYTRISSSKKENFQSSFQLPSRQKIDLSPAKTVKPSSWRPSWQELPLPRDPTSSHPPEIDKQKSSNKFQTEKTHNVQFKSTTGGYTHSRSKALLSLPLDEHPEHNRDYSAHRSSKFQITVKDPPKEDGNLKNCISTAVLPTHDPANSRSKTPVSVTALSFNPDNLLTPLKFRKKLNSGTEDTKDSGPYNDKSTPKTPTRPSYKASISQYTYKQAPSEPAYKSPSSQSYRPKMSLQDFLMGKKLGQGRFGSVHMVVHKPTGAIFALKRIPKATLKEHLMIDQFALEVRLQAAISHPNLVSIYAVFDERQYVYLLLEYLSGGSLYGQLKKKGKFTQEEAAHRTKALCKAVEALHLREVAHRDIKPQNIMMCEGVCKLGDFGWATLCDERRRTYCGTTDYVSPQIVEGKQYGPGVDMWCVGVMAFELIAGRPPFYHLSRQETFKKIEQATPTFPSNFSKEAVEFIAGLLKKIPQDRMSASDALAHRFLAKAQG